MFATRKRHAAHATIRMSKASQYGQNSGDRKKKKQVRTARGRQGEAVQFEKSNVAPVGTVPQKLDLGRSADA